MPTNCTARKYKFQKFLDSLQSFIETIYHMTNNNYRHCKNAHTGHACLHCCTSLFTLSNESSNMQSDKRQTAHVRCTGCGNQLLTYATYILISVPYSPENNCDQHFLHVHCSISFKQQEATINTSGMDTAVACQGNCFCKINLTRFLHRKHNMRDHSKRNARLLKPTLCLWQKTIV